MCRWGRFLTMLTKMCPLLSTYLPPITIGEGIPLGTIFILRKDIRVGGGSEDDNFPLLYVLKMSLRT